MELVHCCILFRISSFVSTSPKNIQIPTETIDIDNSSKNEMIHVALLKYMSRIKLVHCKSSLLEFLRIDPYFAMYNGEICM
jgi:hypothetical protein